MVKSRKAGHNKDHCDFCGGHKNTVPLIVVSQMTGSAICSTCALAVVEQTFAAMTKMEAIIREVKHPTNRMKLVIPEDRTDAAIGKAENRRRNDTTSKEA